MKKQTLLFSFAIFLVIFVSPQLFAQNADFYYKRGNEFISNGELDHAIEDFDKAVSLAPTDPLVWEARGTAHKGKGQLDQAIRDYTMAIALNPEFSIALYNRGIAYYESGEFNKAIEDFSRIKIFNPNLAYPINYRGFAHYKKGERELAGRDFDRALELNPDLIAEWIESGNTFSAEGNYDMAIDNYTKALMMKPDYDDALYYRGLAYYNKGDLDQAIEDFTQAVTVNPGYVQVFNYRGIAYSDKGWPDLAIKDYSKAISLDQNFAPAWNNRGNAYKARGDIDWAFDDYNKALEKEQTIATIWYNRGAAYQNMGELDRAIEDYGKAISLYPEYHDAWNSRGWAYYHKGELDLAIEDFGSAVALYPENANNWYGRGLAHYYKGEPDLAVENYNKAIELYPSATWFWYYRGLTYYWKGETDLAISDFDQAIETGPDNDWALYMRGLIFRNMGEYDRAIEYYNKAISINPNESEHFRLRGYSFKEKGEYDKALEDFSAAVALAPDNISNLEARGGFYRDTGNFDLALADLNRAIEIDPENLYLWLNRGKTYKDKGDPDQANKDFDRALKIYPESLYAWMWKGETYYDKGQYDRAVEYITKGIDCYQDNDIAWYSRALAYYARGNMVEALEDYRQAIKLAEKSNNVQDMFSRAWEFAGSLYHSYPFLNDSIYGNEFFRQYANLTRDVLGRSIAKAERSRSTMGARGTERMQGLLYQYYAGVDFEIHFGLPENAFSYSERLRSRGFLEQMGTEDALKLPGINPADAQRVRELNREISNLQGLLSELNPQADAKKYTDNRDKLNEAEAELAALDGRIAEKVPQYAEFRNPAPVDIARAKSFCGNDLAVLEYVLWDSSIEFKAPADSKYRDRPSINSYCLVITKDGVTPVRLDPDFEYTAMIESLRNKLLTRVMRRIPQESVFEEEVNSLYNALIKPVLKYVPRGIKNLLIVPDGNLAILPFDILRENSGSPYLAERYSITLSPSLSVSVVARQKEVAATEPIIAFGGAWYEKEEAANSPSAAYVEDRLALLSDRMAVLRGNSADALQEKTRAVDFFTRDGRSWWSYLQGSVTEVEGLREIATSEPRVITGRDVSKRNVKRLSLEGTLLNYPIIHFACHGYFNDNLIPQAALVLSEYSGLITESREDGYLSIEDIALLQLNAKMVMLSACETGLGQNKRGDGMSGLSRAFMTAGAQNVGVSLWQISDDATVEFMWGVYRKVIHEGRSFRDAYSEVKEEFRNSTSWRHPFYWACFTLYE